VALVWGGIVGHVCDRGDLDQVSRLEQPTPLTWLEIHPFGRNSQSPRLTVSRLVAYDPLLEHTPGHTPRSNNSCSYSLIVYIAKVVGGYCIMSRVRKYRSLIAIGALVLILAAVLLLSDETVASKFKYNIF